MPIPKPKKDEKHDEFINRGMEFMNNESDDQKQNYAICENQWKQSKQQINDEFVELFKDEYQRRKKFS